jgi:uncharacterized protein YwqG
MNKKPLQLPSGLEKYREQFEATVKPCVKITAEPSKDKTIFDSKFGGYPYLPKDFEFPKDSEGEEMTLLAQINWEQVPSLESYPQTGILQIYIARDHDVYGVDFYEPKIQKDWRVLYFPKIDKENYQTDFSFLGTDEDYYSGTPFEFTGSEDGLSCLKLSFEKAAEPVLPYDYQFDLFVERFSEDKSFPKYYDQENEKIWDEYNEIYETFSHQIGGYASFTQADPRESSEEQWLLLLQINTDEEIMWGDVGIANFFIREDDLKNLDFSNVWYNWDCG